MTNATGQGGQYKSETSKHRGDAAPFCNGYGIDIGFGGDPITETAIRVDFPKPYANTGDCTVQLGGDCRNLKWFTNDSLDYVYSSHVLEDFDRLETESVVSEWVRVIKPGGLLVLLLPDQQKYLKYCLRVNEVTADGVVGNPHHSISDFSAKYLLKIAERLGNVKPFHLIENLGEYSFLLVLQKTKSSASGDKVAELNEKLEKTLLERDQLKENLRKIDNELARYKKNTILKRLLRRIRRALSSG